MQFRLLGTRYHSLDKISLPRKRLHRPIDPQIGHPEQLFFADWLDANAAYSVRQYLFQITYTLHDHTESYCNHIPNILTEVYADNWIILRSLSYLPQALRLQIWSDGHERPLSDHQ